MEPKPTKQDIDNAIKELEKRPFTTDAERLGLKLVNQHDRGAKKLDVDAVLNRSDPRHEGRR